MRNDLSVFVHRVLSGEDPRAVAREAGVMPWSLKEMARREEAKRNPPQTSKRGRKPGPLPARVNRDAELLRCAKDGVPIHHLATVFRLSATTVRNRLRGMGWISPQDRKRPPVPPKVAAPSESRFADRNRVIHERMVAGERKEAIAADFDLAPDTVEAIARALGWRKVRDVRWTAPDAHQRLPHDLITERNAHILHRLIGGDSVGLLAEEYGLKPRTIRRTAYDAGFRFRAVRGAERDRRLAELAARMTYAQAAKEAGVSPETVARALKRHEERTGEKVDRPRRLGRTPRRGPRDPERDAEVAGMARALPMSKVAEHYGLTRERIRQIVRRHERRTGETVDLYKDKRRRRVAKRRDDRRERIARRLSRTAAQALLEDAWVEAGTGCWRTTRAPLSTGYVGVFDRRATTGRRTPYAHLLAYRLWCGEVPEGHWVTHTCHNRACFNPWHLRAVLPGEAIRQSPHWDRERGHWKHSAKLGRNRKDVRAEA